MSIETLISNFHLLRPLWLLGLIPVLLLTWKLWQQRQQSGKWQKLIPEHLLSHLVEGDEQPFSRLPALLTFTAGLITVIALSGPAWRQISTPVEKSLSPLILVVDLSQSMLAADPSPNRLTRAKQKLTDILRARQDGLTGLIAFSGGSHIVSPLTDDNATLVNLVRALHPNIMPTSGSHPEKAVEQAAELMKQGAGQFGEILMLTDEIQPDQAKDIRRLLEGTGNTLSVLGIGTTAGAPIPTSTGGFVRNRDGAIVMAQLDRNTLKSTAEDNGGKYRDLSLDNSDITALLPEASITDETIRVDRTWDSWYDEGRWLALLILPFAALAFRRGWLFSVLLLCFALPPQTSYAFGWDDLWKTQDQQGQELLKNNNPQEAAETFTDESWKAEALDRSGQYAEAAELFGEQTTADSYYNQGNALARAGELDKALESYNKALKTKPDFKAAKKNRKIVDDLKKQQQDNKDQQNQDGSDSGGQGQNKDQSDSDNGSDKDSDQNSDQSSNQQPDNQKNESNNKNSEQDKSDSSQSDKQLDQQNNNSEKQENDAQPQQPQQSSEQEQQNEDNQEQYSQPSEAQSGNSPEDADTNAWLRRIPDDPGGLLRRKFEQQQQQREPVQQGDKTW